MSLERLIVVDGYNVILRTPALARGEGRTLRDSREKLLNLLSWAFGAGDARFLVVFDGDTLGGPDERHARIDVRFARPPQKADDLIRAIVEDQVDRVERLTVVTSDLEVARHARGMGADIALADLFIQSAVGPRTSEIPEKPATLTKKDLEEWADIFRTRRGAARRDDDDEG